VACVIRWVDVGVEARGVIAIGQHATGVIAIGQVATGVIAIGQLARGVLVVGQLGIGIATIGQLSLGVAFNAGMVGAGGTSPGWLVLRMFPWRPSRRPAAASTTVIPGVGEVGRAADALGYRTLLRVLGVVMLAAIWWGVAGDVLVAELLGEGGVLNPVRQLR
jgi:hypothetical protein